MLMVMLRVMLMVKLRVMLCKVKIVVDSVHPCGFTEELTISVFFFFYLYNYYRVVVDFNGDLWKDTYKIYKDSTKAAEI